MFLKREILQKYGFLVSLELSGSYQLELGSGCSLYRVCDSKSPQCQPTPSVSCKLLTYSVTRRVRKMAGPKGLVQPEPLFLFQITRWLPGLQGSVTNRACLLPGYSQASSQGCTPEAWQHWRCLVSKHGWGNGVCWPRLGCPHAMCILMGPDGAGGGPQVPTKVRGRPACEAFECVHSWSRLLKADNLFKWWHAHKEEGNVFRIDKKRSNQDQGIHRHPKQCLNFSASCQENLVFFGIKPRIRLSIRCARKVLMDSFKTDSNVFWLSHKMFFHINSGLTH